MTIRIPNPFTALPIIAFCLLFLWTPTCTVAQSNQVKELISVGGVVFTEPCFEALVEADANNDGDINREEYLTFGQLLGPPGVIDDVSSFEDLPVYYKIAFADLACLCDDSRFGGTSTDDRCCVGDRAMLRVPEPPGEDQSLEDFRYLYVVCGLTDQAAQQTLENRTDTPTAAPTTTTGTRPTRNPAGTPTVPATDPPTAGGTAAPAPQATPPTIEPGTPTSAPVPGGGDGPTSAPVPGGGDGPTSAPVPGGGDGPTSAPVPGGGDGPTSAPVPGGGDGPTSAPVPGGGDGPTSAPVPGGGDGPTSAPVPGGPGTPTTAPVPGGPGTPTTAPVPGGADTPTTGPVPGGPGTPTNAPVDGTAAPSTTSVRVANVEYDIAVGNRPESGMVAFQTANLADLVSAMDVLAPQIASETFDSRRRNLKVRVSGVLRRRLDAQVQLPTSIGTVDNIECDPSVASEDDFCQTISHDISLELSGEDDTEDSVTLFQAALNNAILNQQLQQELMRVNPDTPVRVTTGSGASPSDGDSDSGLTAGATAGIVVGALLFGLVPIVAFFVLRNRKPAEKDEAGEFKAFEGSNSDVQGDELAKADQSSVSDSLYTDAAIQLDDVAPPAFLGANQPDYGKKSSRRVIDELQAGQDVLAEPELDVAPDSSSNAGSSGWSSSAGISSLNTGSMDDSTDAAAAAGTSLAAIGATSALSRKLEAGRTQRSEGDDADEPAVSRDQLDDLIESGDWAAVGATAALLAAASDSQSVSSKSRASRSRTSRTDPNTSLDAARAAELDHLVDAGDWEGVVLAAAKFEAGESGGSRDSRMGSSADSGIESLTGTRPSQSVTTNTSDSPSKAARRAEYREEVEALVRRVVPEEIDNVDEMMNQFKGREDELIETLRTMQERAVAQKARTAGQKSAKIEARKTVQRGVVSGAGAAGSRVEDTPGSAVGGAGAAAGIAAGAAVAAAVATVASKDKTKSPSEKSEETSEALSSPHDSSGTGSLSQKRTALEMAIEAGDWEAVGEAAAMMSDASVTTASTTEINRLASTNLSMSSGGTGKSSRTGVNAERAAKLDAMIEKGDWTAVVTAAKEFRTDDKRASKVTSPSREEEEALAQAEVWMKIAEQKKAEGATDAGASDAAEWAISRSLSQLKDAEKKLHRDEDQEDEV
jgi:hypothetical protein